MSKTEVAINTAGDNAVLSAVGNLLLKLHAAGSIGVLFNLTTLTICAYMRAQSEIRKPLTPLAPPTTRKEAVLRDLRTSLAVSGLMQLSVATEIAINGGGLNEHTIKEMAVPVLFGVGSLISAKSILRTVFRGVARATTATEKNIQGSKRKAVNYIFGQPDMYWVAGLMAAGGSKIATGIFATSFAIQLAQGFWQMQSHPGMSKGLMAPFMNMNNAPMLMQGLGCGVSAGLYAHGGHAIDASAMGLYTLGFLAYVAENKWQGVVEGFRAMRPAVKRLIFQTTTAIA